MKDADAAVRAAENPQPDETLARHLVFMADRKVDDGQSTRGDFARRGSAHDAEPAARDGETGPRTHEADVANDRVAAARTDSAEQKARSGSIAS